MIQFKNISKIYINNDKAVLGLKNINLELDDAGLIAICGESGSGKTTFLKILSKMDSPTEGEIIIDGINTSEYDLDEMNDYRFQNISFIYQDYNLIESMTILDNVMMPLIIRNYSYKEAKKISLEMIKKVGLENLKSQKCNKLSGGEKQRCAIARALVTNSKIIISDEPTANLDFKTSKEIITLLSSLSKDRLVVIVTHNYDEIKEYADRRIILKNNEIFLDERLNYIKNNLNPQLKSNNISFKNLIYVSFVNSLKSFSKAIIMFLASAIFIALTIITFVAESISLNNYKYTNKFVNPKENSLYVFANEDVPINEKLLEKYDFINKSPSEELEALYYNIQGLNGSYFYYMNEKEDLYVGRYPENKDEVCICLEGNRSEYECKEYLNKTISNRNMSDEFIIVGVSLGSKKPYLFGNDYLRTYTKIISSNTKVCLNYDGDFSDSTSFSDTTTKILEFNKVYCSESSTNKIIFPKSFEGSINSYDICIEVNGNYHLSDKKNKFNVEYLGDYLILEVEKDYIFDNFYDVIISNVNINDEIQYWKDNGYFAVDILHYTTNDNFFNNNSSIFISIFLTYIILIGAFLIFIFIFISLFKLRKKEYSVLSDLGLIRRKNNQLICFEFMWYFLLSFVVIIIFAFPIIKNSYSKLSIFNIFYKTLITIIIFILLNCFVLKRFVVMKKRR